MWLKIASSSTVYDRYRLLLDRNYDFSKKKKKREKDYIERIKIDVERIDLQITNKY